MEHEKIYTSADMMNVLYLLRNHKYSYGFKVLKWFHTLKIKKITVTKR